MANGCSFHKNLEPGCNICGTSIRRKIMTQFKDLKVGNMFVIDSQNHRESKWSNIDNPKIKYLKVVPFWLETPEELFNVIEVNFMDDEVPLFIEDATAVEKLDEI